MPPKNPIIAIIDDDKIFQLTASKTIQSLGYNDNILQFENGDEALKYLSGSLGSKDLLPDYIFLDINMPIIDGWMFLESYSVLKARLAKPATIYLVSSSIDPRDIKRAKSNANVSEYVTKPVLKDKFRQLLRW